MTETKLATAIEKSQEALSVVKELHEVMRSMTEKQRKLFAALSQGKDELEAILFVKEHSVFTKIVKYVFTSEGKRIDTKKITLENVQELDGTSYERLLNLCRAKVKVEMGGMLPENYRADITDYFKIIAPEAYGVLVELMSDRKTAAAVRLKASMEVLDRAGYQPRGAKSENKMPVQVNILFGSQPKAENNPMYTIPEDSQALYEPVG